MIRTFTGAGIGVGGGTTKGRRSLKGSTMGTATNSAASTLEGVVESDPVSDLVSQRASLVERSVGTSGEGGVEENDAVKIGVCLVLVREGGVTENTVSVSNYIANSVNIECEGVSHSKRGLHIGLLGGT